MNAIVETLNAAGRAFVDFALPMLIQSSLLIVALLLFDLVLRRRVRAVFRYWVWMLVLVKLVLPPSLGSPVSVGTWLGDELEAPTAALLEPAPEPPPPIAQVLSGPPIGFAEPYVPVSGSVVPSSPPPSPVPKQEPSLVARSAPAANPATATLSWQGLMLLGWATVVVALFLLLFQRALFVRDLAAQAEEAPALLRAALADCRARMGVRGRVTLKISTNASSPAVCGLLHPKILIPRTLAPKLSGRDLQAVLLHELAHVKRGDLWINLVQTLLQIIYFYNPLLWLANVAIRRVREQAVDEAVLVAMGERAREYPDTLIHVAKLAFRRRPALSLRLVGVVESRSALTGRVRHILGRPLPKSTRLGLLGLLAIIIVAAVVLPMAKARPMTDRARKIVVLAEEEARALNHSYVGTEHILIALARDGDAVSAKVLANLGVDIDTLRAETKKRVKPSSDAQPPGKLPHTFRVGGTFEFAKREAKALGHDYIGTEHILLSLMKQTNSVAVRILTDLGLTSDQISEGVVGLVQPGNARAVGGGMPDRDGDGLSDFQERHKYLTDPTTADSDGDGTPDGDWDERREYAYSVRTIMRYMPPFDEDGLNDDFQDGRVLNRTDEYIEVEVIHYPFATGHESIPENPNWRWDNARDARLAEYLAPGVTTNWDEPMRKDLLAALKTDGIDVESLTDKQVVEQVARWLLHRSRSLDKVFTTYYVDFPDGRPRVYPGLEDAFRREFERDSGNYDWTIEQHFDHELLGKGMFYNKTHGSCTSTAVYLSTALRALGIPTRIILASPAVDASDRAQILMVKSAITHHRVRLTMLAGLGRSSHGFTNHTFNEVYVGNRWCRLDGSQLGCPAFGLHRFGLQTHLYTLNDLSDVNFAPTWGRRYAKGERNDMFQHDNPYSAIEVSELFGPHGSIPNPPFTAQHLASHPQPDIFLLYPSSVHVWQEFIDLVAGGTANKTGRPHRKEFYDNLFDGIWLTRPQDILVLLFSLDTPERVPEGYEDLLPKPWSEIESALERGESIELGGDARDMKVILLAAPTRGQVIPLIQNSKLLAALNPSSTMKPEGLAVEDGACPTVKFASGVTVRLLGVCEHPSEGKQWWRPDGSPMDTAPYRTTGSRIPHHEGRRDYEFALRLSGPEGTKVKWLVPGSTQGSDTGQAFGKGHNHLADVYAYTANQPEGVETSNVLLGVSSGPWETRAVHGDVSHEATYGLKDKEGSAVAFGIAYARDGETHVPVTVNFPSDRMDYRILAVDEQGESHLGGRSGSGGNVLMSLTCTFDVPLSRVKELRFQTRPRIWVAFGNVSLRPGRKTDVQISMAATADRSAGGGAPAEPERARERPAPDSAGVVAELPNGGTVELLGACRHPSAGRPWWRPNGTPLEEAPYDKPGALVTADEPNTVAYELALRVRDLPDGWDAAMWSVDTRFSGAADPPYKAGRRLHDLRWLMIQVPPDQTSCTIRCDIAAPWQTIARSSPEIDVAQQAAGGRVAFSEIREGSGGVRVTVTGSVSDRDHHPYFRDRGHHRVVALTKGGQIVESSSGGLPFFDMVGSAGAYFARLSLDDVEEFQFQVRPVSWVDFGNVSLRPGHQTEVSVKLGQGRHEGTETPGRGAPGIPDGRRLYLPDLETPEADVVLDLATGQLLPGEPLSRDRRHFEKLGRGDVAYEYARNKGGLLCLRGARLHRRTETGLEPLTPDVRRDSFVVYFIENVPAQFQVTTAEGRAYQFDVIARERRGDRGGVVVEIRPTTDGDAPAEPETPTATDTSETASVVAELANGVTVELVAYSELGRDGLKWWTPDGESTAIPGIYEADVEGHGTVLAVRIEPQPEAGVSAWFFQPPDVRNVLNPVWRLNDSDLWLISLGEGRSYANVELQARVRDPVVLGTVTVKPIASSRAAEIASGGVSIKDVEDIDSGATAFTTHGTAFGPGSPGPAVVAALDTAGRVHPIRRVPRGMLEEMGGDMYGMDGSARYRVDVPPDRFAGVVIEGYSERAGSVKFRNLSLRPGSKVTRPTQVRVVVEREQRGPWWHPSGYSSNLERLGRVLSEYAERHGGRYPGDLRALRDYFDDTRWKWLQEHAVYVGADKSSADAGPLAYEKTLLQFGFGTYVLYPDKRVDFNIPAELQEFGIPARREADEAGSVESTMAALRRLALAVVICMQDQGGALASTLSELKPYLSDQQLFAWAQEHVVYVGGRVTDKSQPQAVATAYEKRPQTNGARYVCFLDGHVELVTPQRQQQLGIPKAHPSKPFPSEPPVDLNAPVLSGHTGGLGALGRHALSFDGVDDCLIVPPSASLTLQPPFCVEMWIKPDFSDPRLKDHVPFMSLVRKGEKVSDPPKIRHYQTGGFVALVHPPGEPGARCSGIFCTGRNSGEVAQDGIFGGRYNPLPLKRPGWMHMFIPYSGKTYLPSPDGEIAIGENIAPFGVPFRGQIAELRLWNRRLSDAEIRNYGATSLRGDEPGLLGCWTFEEGAGQIVRDITLNGNHARLGKSSDADAADPMWVSLEASRSVPEQVSGRVLGPDGTPVAGARVALCSERLTVIVRDGRLDQPQTSDMEKGEIVETDARGRFRFESEPNESFSLVAAHDAGFASVGADEFVANREIRLELWGRVVGQLAEGRKARGDQIWMGGLPNETWLKHKRQFRYETRCDAEGQFSFSKVPAGWFEVGYLTAVGDFTSSITSRTPVVVEAGQTVTVRLGGEGRPVIGRFVPPSGYAGPVYFGAGTRALDTVWPERPTPDNYDQMTRRQQQQWIKQWHETPEAEDYMRAVWHDLNRRHYTFRIRDDGTFRIEDVIPGQYRLTVWLDERHSGQGRPEEFGGYYGAVEVPPMAEAYSEEPLDLGDLELKLRRPLHVGDAAPLFEALTLDDRDIRLADYRGRFVLLALWAPTFHPDIDRLKELYAEYEGTGRLQIIGIGGTDTLDEVKSYAEENEIPWPQIYLGPDWDSELLAKLGGQLQTLLIDPEGKIVATWLRDEELTDAVREALGKTD